MRERDNVRTATKKLTTNNLTNYMKNYNLPLSRCENDGGPFIMEEDGAIELDGEGVSKMDEGLLDYQESSTKGYKIFWENLVEFDVTMLKSIASTEPTASIASAFEASSRNDKR